MYDVAIFVFIVVVRGRELFSVRLSGKEEVVARLVRT